MPKVSCAIVSTSYFWTVFSKKKQTRITSIYKRVVGRVVNILDRSWKSEGRLSQGLSCSDELSSSTKVRSLGEYFFSWKTCSFSQKNLKMMKILTKSCSKRAAPPSQTRKQVFWKHFKCPDRAISNRFFLKKYHDLVSFPTPKTPFGVFKEFVQRGGIWTLKWKKSKKKLFFEKN